MNDYQDRTIRADDREIALRWYFFPFGTKRIAWDRIVEVREHDMGTGITGGRWRIWGSGDLVHWLPLDMRRPKKRQMFIFFLQGSHARPCVTPDDPQAFRALLANKGVKLVPLARPNRD
jgi:hypothetical protein